MALRFTVASLVACGLIACAVGASDDGVGAVLGDGGLVIGPDGAMLQGDAGGQTGPTGSTGATGPGTFDSGPPATVGGGGQDAGTPEDEGGCSGTALSNGSCTTLADCPYACKANVAGVQCTSSACVITCKGETYDVNGVLGDGCEVAGKCVESQGGAPSGCAVDVHTQALAFNVGSFSCDDSSSAQTLSGTVPSDDRAHDPAIDAFDPITGAAPNFFALGTSGGLLCENDANMTLTMTLAPSGSTTQAACYVLTMVTDKSGTQTCNTDSSGACSISNGSGSYGTGSTVYVSVAKNPTCAAASTADDGQFTISGHL